MRSLPEEEVNVISHLTIASNHQDILVAFLNGTLDDLWWIYGLSF